MTIVEALPMDIQEGLYDFCRDDECLDDALLRALREKFDYQHDLRKNPQDLPEINHYVILYNRETGYEIARKPPYEEYYDDLWITKDNRSIRAKDAVLWAEIPSFKVVI